MDHNSRSSGVSTGADEREGTLEETATDTPLLVVLRRMAGDGFDGQFMAIDDAMVRCLTCQQTVAASDLDADDVVRLEGASDPSDMLVIVPVVCPHCAAKGPLVLNYGPEATVEEADVLAAMPRHTA
jgi:hypothetical protein